MRFGIIGAGGYIARKHFEAIKKNGGEIVAISDINDSVGIVDSYNKNAVFYKDYRKVFNHELDYVSICTPNYLHFDQIVYARGRGVKVICEKPIVLNSKQLGYLDDGVNCILQLRLGDFVDELKNVTGQASVNYITPRGDWYMKSWKNDVSKSGGLVTNIGVHLFDLMCYCFGEPKEVSKDFETDSNVCGRLVFENIVVDWDLSIDKNLKPMRFFSVWENGFMDSDNNIDLSGNFTDLHTRSYERILSGNGFKPKDCINSIKIVEKLR